MPRQRITARIPFTLTGTGVESQSIELVAKDIAGSPHKDYQNGVLRYVCMRQEAGGLATAGTCYIGCDRVSMAAPSAVPRESLVMKSDSLVMTADATDSFFESGFDTEPSFRQTLTLALDVTAATGDWTIKGFVDVEF
jgi:hypothetical protein